MIDLTQGKEMKKEKRLNLNEYFEHASPQIKKNSFAEKCGISYPTLNRILNGGDYAMSTALKLVQASNNIICPVALLKAIKLKEEQKVDHPKNRSSKPPKNKDKNTKLKNLS